MSEPSNPLEQLLLRAGDGDESAVGELFEHHRPYLRLLAQQTLDSGIRVRVDESNLVQQTLLSAFKNFKNFQGKNPGQFIAWLQTIHERNVVDVIRTHTAQKRDHTRETPLDDGPELDQGKLANRVETPSAQAMRSEAVVQRQRHPSPLLSLAQTRLCRLTRLRLRQTVLGLPGSANSSVRPATTPLPDGEPGEVLKIDLQTTVGAIALSPDGRHVAVVSAPEKTKRCACGTPIRAKRC